MTEETTIQKIKLLVETLSADFDKFSGVITLLEQEQEKHHKS